MKFSCFFYRSSRSSFIRLLQISTACLLYVLCLVMDLLTYRNILQEHNNNVKDRLFYSAIVFQIGSNVIDIHWVIVFSIFLHFQA